MYWRRHDPRAVEQNPARFKKMAEGRFDYVRSVEEFTNLLSFANFIIAFSVRLVGWY